MRSGTNIRQGENAWSHACNMRRSWKNLGVMAWCLAKNLGTWMTKEGSYMIVIANTCPLDTAIWWWAFRLEANGWKLDWERDLSLNTKNFQCFFHWSMLAWVATDIFRQSMLPLLPHSLPFPLVSFWPIALICYLLDILIISFVSLFYYFTGGLF